MPNNLVFNDVAGQLRTQIFGSDTTTAIKTDSSGNMSVTGNVTASIIDTVTVTGNVTATITSSVPVTGGVTATIAGTASVTATIPEAVTVTGNVTATIPEAVTVTGNVTATIPEAVTVTGNVTATIPEAVTVTGNVTATIPEAVTVTGNVTATITSSVPITGSVTQGAVAVTSSNTTLSGVTTTGIALTIDTSQQRVYSFYVRNFGAAAVSVKLQISPTDTDAYFMDDPSSEVSVTASTGKVVLVAQKYLNYTRLYYEPSAAASFDVYYNARL